jgi:putative ABC transport system permease protein
MKTSTQIKLALINFTASKLRAFLAILGVLVGCASFVALLSVGKLATNKALSQFKNLDRNLLAVSINPALQKTKQTSKDFFDIDTALNLKTISSDIIEVAPYTQLYGPVNFFGHKIEASTVGATENLARILKINLQAGRFVSYYDQNSLYCTIGQDVYKVLKQCANEPINTQIRLRKDFFTIVGVIPAIEENIFLSTNPNKTIFIPIKTAELIVPQSTINNVIIELKRDADIENIKSAIREYIEVRTIDKQQEKKIEFHSSKQITDSIRKQSKILSLFLGFIGSIAFMVGGIGIMNIMLVSAAERKREIGISLAIGARRGDIRKLFLIEATMLSLLGGVLGIIIGISISFIIAKGKGWEFCLFLMPLFLGFSFSVLVGIFFGFYPAHKASKLNPIDVLHFE